MDDYGDDCENDSGLELEPKMHTRCARLRAQRSCSGDVRVARVHVIALVVDAVVGLMLVLIAHIVVVVFVVAFP